MPFLFFLSLSHVGTVGALFFFSEVRTIHNVNEMKYKLLARKKSDGVYKLIAPPANVSNIEHKKKNG